MKKAFFLLFLMVFSSCQNDERKEIEVIRLTIQSGFYNSEHTIREIYKNIQSPLREKFNEILELASELQKIRLKAFISRNDSIFYKSKESIIEYAYNLQSLVLKNKNFEIFNKTKLDIEALKSADSELIFLIQTLKITSFEGELMDYIASMIGIKGLHCFDDFFKIFPSDNPPTIGKPYYFVMQSVDFDGVREKDMYSVENLVWKLNGKIQNQPYELQKLGNAKLIIFTPTQKGKYEFSANINNILFDGDGTVRISEISHKIQVK